MDWEFDTDLKMTYNNPVYLEQCKLRKVEIDDSGFVEQVPLDMNKLVVEEIDDDDEFEDEFDNMPDELFDKRSDKSSTSPKPDKPDRLGRLDRPNRPDTSPKPSESIKQSKPVGIGNLNDDDDSDINEVTVKIQGTKSTIPASSDNSSVRDKLNSELGNTKPNIKLNVDKPSSSTSSESTASTATTPSNKPKIKLNIKK